MKNRFMTVAIVGSLVAGTAYIMWNGQPVPKAEAETAQTAPAQADAIIVRK